MTFNIPMRTAYGFKRSTAIVIVLCSFSYWLLQAQAETNSVVADNANKDSTERTIGNKGKFLANTKIVTGDTNTQERVVQAKKQLKELRQITNDSGQGPQAIEEAAAHLSKSINMACPPTKCIEHAGIFYFSGGTSSKPVYDFSSGLAIKKGEKTIYSWSSLDKPDEGKSK